jgi:RNA recognition motif-containing protein
VSAGKAAKKAPAKESDSEEEEDVEMKNGNGAEEEVDNAILEVFVGNLPFSATEQSVSGLFE